MRLKKKRKGKRKEVRRRGWYGRGGRKGERERGRKR